MAVSAREGGQGLTKYLAAEPPKARARACIRYLPPSAPTRHHRGLAGWFPLTPRTVTDEAQARYEGPIGAT